MRTSSWLAAILLSAASSAALAERVVILPFNTLNVAPNQQWISKGVQENLAADLGRNGLEPLPYNAQVIVEDNATAVRIARTLNAPYVVRGAVQVVGGDVRLTAQLIDTRTGDTVRTALVTGTTDTLLRLEDQLAGQIRGTPEAQPATAGALPAAAPIIVPQAQPQVIVISQPEPV